MYSLAATYYYEREQMIYLQEKSCLNCKKFRLIDTESGVCRVDKTVDNYPVKGTKENCTQWIDAGQQYYIRLGWIKKQQKTEAEEPNKC